MKNPIVILGPGRCGSTLLQRILNTSENITIWGEHEGFLSKLAESYYLLTKSEGMEKNFYSQNIDPAIVIGSLTDYQACPNWINSFDRKFIKDTYRSMIVRLLNNKLDTRKNIWGFKEIRYTRQDSTLDMWLELFPLSSLIFSIRNPFDVVRSMILDWNNPQTIEKIIEKNDLNQIRQMIIRFATRWNKVVASFAYWIEEKKTICYVEKYEDLIVNSEKKIKQIFDFLDFPMPETALNPMSIRVGSRKSPYQQKICEIIYHMREDIWQIVGDTAKYFDYNISFANNLKPQLI